jgi:hypothetical protein
MIREPDCHVAVALAEAALEAQLVDDMRLKPKCRGFFRRQQLVNLDTGVDERLTRSS